MYSIGLLPSLSISDYVLQLHVLLAVAPSRYNALLLQIHKVGFFLLTFKGPLGISMTHSCSLIPISDGRIYGWVTEWWSRGTCEFETTQTPPVQPQMADTQSQQSTC